MNPARGPYHFRAPSKILWRTVRGKVVLCTLSYRRFFIVSCILLAGHEEELDASTF